MFAGLDAQDDTNRSGDQPAPDGERFLVFQPIDAPSDPITVVLGWQAELDG